MSTPRKPHPEIHRGLALIGGRGCGKSSVSKRLAKLNRSFMLFSTDDLLRYEAQGRTIPQIVEADGWRGFREREYEVLRKLADFERGALIDCGGGIVVDLDDEGQEIYSERKVALLRRHCLVVYLQRDSHYLHARISDDGNRPSLSDEHSFHEIMARRDPFYRKAADWVLECGEQSKTELTQAVLEWFYSKGETVRGT